MAHVMSLIIFPMSIGSMSHVVFKKWLCRPVNIKGPDPYWWGGLCRVLLVMDSGRVVCIKWGQVLWNGGVSSKCVFIIGSGVMTLGIASWIENGGINMRAIL